MKRRWLYWLTAICAVLCMTGNVYAESDLKMQALADLQKTVIKTLPAEGKIIRIAIMDFENDDGTIRNAITSAITEKTSYKVIERADLDVILKEQGMQLKDIMDEKTKIQHGRIKGVQGLILGKVLGQASGFMSYAIDVNLKMDDVEKGEVVFSRNLSGKAVSPMRKWLVGMVLVIPVLIVIFFLRARRSVVVKAETMAKDVGARVDLSLYVKKALSLVEDAKTHMLKSGNNEPAIALKDLERDLIYLREQVEHAARGSVELRSKEELRDSLESDRRNKEIFDNVKQVAENLYATAMSGNVSQLEQNIVSLKKAMKNAMNEFQDRKL